MFCYQIHKKWKSSLEKVKMSGMNNIMTFILTEMFMYAKFTMN